MHYDLLNVGRNAAMVIVLSAAALMSPAARASVYLVDDSAPASGGNDGSSWEHAFNDLNDGLKAAQAGDEVRIAQGLYKPALPGGSRLASFLVPSGVIVQGGYAGFGAEDPDQLNHKQFITTLSGDLDGNDGPNFAKYDENSLHVFTVDGVDAGSQIRGVTIRAGNANIGDSTNPHSSSSAVACLNNAIPTLVDCVVRDNRSFTHGGAIEAAGVVLQRCEFINNRVFGFYTGGALRLGAASSSIVDCIFQGNRSDNVGGAIYRSSSSGTLLTIKSTRFSGNYSSETTGAISSRDVKLFDCDFIDNVGIHGKGAFSLTHATVVNCRFLDNSSQCIPITIGSAGSISGESKVINCVFSGNHGSVATLQITDWVEGEVLVANCTFVGNTSNCNSGAAIDASPNAIIANSIIWNNTYDDNGLQSAQIGASPATLANNIIQGWDGTLGGVNNSGEDPQFIDADGEDNDFGTPDDNPRLNAGSPAINAGDHAFISNDEFDLDDDGDTAELLPLDLDLQMRIADGIIDLGPYEGPDAAACIGDIAPGQGDGAVDVDDLLLVINNWNASGGIVADINGDDIVNVDDLLAVINAWGACE